MSTIPWNGGEGMPKRLVVAAISGTIYDARLTKTPGVMSTTDRRDRTDEAISAVAEHMKAKAEMNKDSPGFWQYQWPGVGTLTWETEGAPNGG